MQQTYSNKIISLHLEDCRHGCPNSSVCYLKRRPKSKGSPLPLSFKDDILEQGFIVHDALCRPMDQHDVERLKRFANYNVTISVLNFKSGLSYESSQVQISVYSRQHMDGLPGEAIKLYLIKDKESLRCASELSQNTRNIHFNVDASFVPAFSAFFMQSSERNVSIDTCLGSWILNRECPYTSNYIDVSYDWTVRKCPFERIGIQIPEGLITDKNYIDLFSLEHKVDCAYAKRFS